MCDCNKETDCSTCVTVIRKWDCSTCVTVIRKQLGLFYMCDCNKETVGTVLHV